MDFKYEYKRWLEKAIADENLIRELKEMEEIEIEDAFYRNLEFGTGGLRGIIGAGTNRMNIYTVAKASQGLANYLGNNASVVIGYDSRIMSDIFAMVTAGVFTKNGIHVYLWSELLPVPTVSYAIRYLHASAGIMITASHNSSKYNGYKIYGADGCQITIETANRILSEIENVNCFELPINFEPEVEYIKEDVLNSFLAEVKKQSVLFGDQINRDISIVYSPLNGTGLKPVTRILKETGFTNITIVKEQEFPDGNFSTCPSPNPEAWEAMELGIKYCRKIKADILLATDPDCDRCGIAVKDNEDYKLLTGNEVGLLLLDFICSQRISHNQMPNHPIFVKTIVTMDLAEKIAEHYGVETINVLTGFKFIGEIIESLSRIGREQDYIFGFEESYGYLTGTYIRDKDGVNAAYMICEMFAYYKTRGVSLLNKLNELYSIFGYSFNTLHTYEFSSSVNMKKINKIMTELRSNINIFEDYSVKTYIDYAKGINDLPKSNMIKLELENNIIVIIRPSGTEPKLKIYISLISDNSNQLKKKEEFIARKFDKMIYSII